MSKISIAIQPQVRCFCPHIRREIHSALRPQTPPPCCARSPAPTGGGLPVVELPRCEPRSPGGPLGWWLYDLREVAGIPGWKWLCNLQEVVTWSGISRTSGFPTVGTIHSVGAHQDWRNAMSPGAPAPQREPPTTSSVPPAGGKDPHCMRVGGYRRQPIPQVDCFCPPIRLEIHSALRPQPPLFCHFFVTGSLL